MNGCCSGRGYRGQNLGPWDPWQASEFLSFELIVHDSAGGFQGCYLDNHRNNGRCARAVRKRPREGRAATAASGWGWASVVKGACCRRSHRIFFFFGGANSGPKSRNKISFKKCHEAHQIDQRNALNAKMDVGGGVGLQSHDPRNNQHNPRDANYWAPRTRKRHQQEHRPQRPTERSDLTQHAKGRPGDCPGPRKGATTRWTVTQGGGGGGKHHFFFSRVTSGKDWPKLTGRIASS